MSSRGGPLPPDVEEQDLLAAVARLNARILAGVVGALTGLALLLATLVLVAKDGPHPGPHLVLLAQYFPGYSVTVGGAFVGFAYAFVLGAAAGYAIGRLYNRIVSLRDTRG